MPNNEEVKIVLGDCPKDCRFNGIGHGHCLKCGELTQPVMKCECEFRKPNNEDWIKEFDEFLDDHCIEMCGEEDALLKEIYPSVGGFYRIEKNTLKSFILKLKSRWVEEEIKYLNEVRRWVNADLNGGKITEGEHKQLIGFINYQVNTHLYQKIEELKVLTTPNKDI